MLRALVLIAVLSTACQSDECERTLACDEQAFYGPDDDALDPNDPLSARTRGAWVNDPQGRLRPADLSCLYDPAPTYAPQPEAFQVTVTQVGQVGLAFAQPMAFAQVEVWWRDVDPYNRARCEVDRCTSVETDENGRFDIELDHQGRYGFRIAALVDPDPGRDYLPVIGRHWQPDQDAPTGTLPGLTRGAAVDLALTVDAEYDPEAGLIIGELDDCQHRSLGGAVLRIAPLVGPPLRYGADASSPHLLYPNNQLGPYATTDANTTGADGRYLAFNLPPGVFRIEAWAREHDLGPLLKLACTEVHVAADSLTAVHHRPLRDPSPPASCR